MLGWWLLIARLSLLCSGLRDKDGLHFFETCGTASHGHAHLVRGEHAHVTQTRMNQTAREQKIAAAEKTRKLVTPCTSEAKFLKDSILYFHCKFSYGDPEEAECKSKGCKVDDLGLGEGFETCICEIESSCQELGGEWTGETCQRNWAVAADDWNLEEAAQAGSCDGIRTAWDADLTHALEREPVTKNCCSNYPATFCNPSAKKMTPCKDEDDFMPDAMYSTCDFNEAPSKEACIKAGCHVAMGEDPRCDCDDRGTCEEAGGIYNPRTCREEINKWDDERSIIENAASGTCNGVRTYHGLDLTQWIQHPAMKCCASYPASVCEKTAKIIFPCRRDDSFLKDLTNTDLNLKCEEQAKQFWDKAGRRLREVHGDCKPALKYEVEQFADQCCSDKRNTACN